jgi:hypothetical protein
MVLDRDTHFFEFLAHHGIIRFSEFLQLLRELSEGRRLLNWLEHFLFYEAMTTQANKLGFGIGICKAAIRHLSEDKLG